MQVGSIIRQIRNHNRLYLVIGETYGTWEILMLDTQETLRLAKTTKGFEVIG